MPGGSAGLGCRVAMPVAEPGKGAGGYFQGSCSPLISSDVFGRIIPQGFFDPARSMNAADRLGTCEAFGACFWAQYSRQKPSESGWFLPPTPSLRPLPRTRDQPNALTAAVPLDESNASVFEGGADRSLLGRRHFASRQLKIDDGREPATGRLGEGALGQRQQRAGGAALGGG